MRTGRIYVVTIIQPGMDDENLDTRACGLALYTKYRSRAQYCQLIEVNLNNSLTSVPEFKAQTGNSTTKEQIGAPSGDGGVYIVGNFCRLTGTVETLLPKALSQMLKSLNLGEIRKLCLIACKAASKFASQPSYLELFCAELAKEPAPLRPMIAGWDSYVEVMVMAAGVPRYVDSSKGLEFSDEDKRNNVGRKIASITANKNDFMTNPTALAHKLAVRWDGAQCVPILLMGGWSDKPVPTSNGALQ